MERGPSTIGRYDEDYFTIYIGSSSRYNDTIASWVYTTPSRRYACALTWRNGLLGTRLQRKTLAVISLTFVALIVVLYLVSHAIVMGGFADQENVEANQNVQRVVSALEDNLRTLEGTTLDWSLWNDTDKYVQDHNQTYYDTNLANISIMMKNNELSLAVFVDKNGQTVFQKAIDYHTGKEIPIPAGLGMHVYPGGSLLIHKDADSSITGVVSLNGWPMLLASEPIMMGTGEGAVDGTLVFGRSLDEEAIEHLSKTNFLGLTFTSVTDAISSGKYKDVLPLIGTSSDVMLRILDDSTIAGYHLINDVYGMPSLILEVRMARDIYQRGQQTLNYYMLTLSVVGVVFAVVTMLLFGKLVLNRVSRLRGDVRKISANSDMTIRVAATGEDELADLAHSINEMLGALQNAREEQRAGEEKYRAVVEQTNEAILLADARSRRFIEANPAAQVLLGYGHDELMSLTIHDIAFGHERESAPLATSGNTDTLRLSTEQKYRRKNGTPVYVEVSEIHITYGENGVLCIVARDITERKRAEELLRELAMRDGLTGLFNRREMQRILKENIERYKRSGQNAALILMDLDYFKSVNDTYGHQVGDDVIRWIAAVTQDLVRAEDKVARYGGEELAIILPGADYESALSVAERIRQAIAHRPFAFVRAGNEGESEVLVPITVSLGVAVLPDVGNSEESIVKAADSALYAAKHAGRNRTVTYPMVEHDTLQAASVR